MEAFPTTDGRFSITPILVARKDECQVLQRHFMCDCREDSRIVVLQVVNAKARTWTARRRRTTRRHALLGTSDSSTTVKHLSEAQTGVDAAATIVSQEFIDLLRALQLQEGNQSRGRSSESRTHQSNEESSFFALSWE
jgi:hypothetical protein